MILRGDFYPCFRTCIDFHPCILNEVCLPYSPSLDEDIQVEAGSSRAVSAHFSLPVPLGCALPHSCTHTFGCWQTPPGAGQAPRWFCVLAACTERRASSEHRVSVDAAQMLIISEGCSACWKMASFAVITSLLAQQLRLSCYWSGYWLSATRMLCPLLRGQRV